MKSISNQPSILNLTWNMKENGNGFKKQLLWQLSIYDLRRTSGEKPGMSIVAKLAASRRKGLPMIIHSCKQALEKRGALHVV